MELVACTPPTGVLEPAPLTSLCEVTPNLGLGDWAGFWNNDRYYVRGRERSGVERWFEIRSDVAEPIVALSFDAASRRDLGARHTMVTSSDGIIHVVRKRRISYAVWQASRRHRARGQRGSSALGCLFAVRRPQVG
jgi:hypothetical protein